MVAIKSLFFAAAASLASLTTAVPTWNGHKDSLGSIVSSLACPKGSVLFKAHNEGIVPVSLPNGHQYHDAGPRIDKVSNVCG